MNNSLKNSFKWKTLQHNGVAFPPDYSYKAIKIGIKNDQFQLNKDQEELIYAWAKKKDSHYIRDNVFQKNFLKDLKKLLPNRFQYIKNISDIDFSEAFGLVDEEQRTKYLEKEKIKSLPIEEKKKLSAEKKRQKELLKKTYGIAIIDGVEVEVANWLVEPPGLFMGRGLHPLRGRWKPRIRPQDVILNLDENSPVPEGAWKKVVHDHTSTWLATWTETLTSKRKYVWLHDSALLRQDKDREKYEKAKNLEKHVEKIEKDIINKMINEKDLNQKKIATVCYLILKLAMRVGDEKDTDETDTVGASTLRVEHIKFPETDDGRKFIQFNFLGKDSVPWQKTIEISSVDTNTLYENLRFFMINKQKDSEIFDNINSAKVNSFLRNIDPKNVPGLTAKVFRTYLATKIVKDALKSPPIQVSKNSSEIKKIYISKIANLSAAIECNHKKGIDPNNPASKKAIERLEESLEKKKQTIMNLRNDINLKKWKTEKQKEKLESRIEKITYQLKLQKETRDYNLGTSLRNYIDPRVMKWWMDSVGLDWKKVYTTTLQRKFKWIETSEISKDV
ncbi:MAG TPA: DNA topoisomerase I [Nitrososphaeraceae archaeon]|nr:DNA topoisomerase I [Nitrososphaeraceae archaeon]